MKDIIGNTVPLKRPPQLDGHKFESAALKQLTSLLNNPEFSEETDGSPGALRAAPADEAQEETVVTDVIPRPPVPVVPRPPAPPAILKDGVIGSREEPTRLVFPKRIFTTGRMKVGKDTFLKSLGMTVLGFADPLYAMAEVFFGTFDKAMPGMREFLQKAGQWGRGTVTVKYPLTTERAAFVTMVRTMGGAGLLPKSSRVLWESYGRGDNIWIESLLARAGNQPAYASIGVSNVRFDNEHSLLLNAGFTHFHVMCSAKTWAERLAKDGLNPKSPEVSDISEQLAHKNDSGVIAQLQRQPKGPKLRVIWHDQNVPSPSPRFITLADIAASTEAK